VPVDVDNRHGSLRVDKRALGRHLRTILAAVGRPRARVDVSLVGDPEIRELNATWRGVDDVTDVLSFAIGDDPADPNPLEHLGDIVISLDTAKRQARALAAALPADDRTARYTMRTETLFLATHGLLHLLGHDHQRDAEAAAMEALERRFMAPITAVDPHGLDRTPHGR